MIRHLTLEEGLEEDLELKRFATTPPEEKPRFKWREVLLDERLVQPEIKVEVNGNEREFDLAEVAETIGNALTDLLLSRREEEIFTIENQEFVAEISKEVGSRLQSELPKGNPLKLAEEEVYRLIEKALIRRNAHDVAKSVVLRRSRLRNGRNGSKGVELLTVRLIRRNGQVVPWNVDKIEIAVRKAFLSNNFDSNPAVKIARAATERVRDLGQSFIHIEDLQDIVQEELMRHGHYKVAESYILYRAFRARLREEQAKARSNRRVRTRWWWSRRAMGTPFSGMESTSRSELSMR